MDDYANASLYRCLSSSPLSFLRDHHCFITHLSSSISARQAGSLSSGIEEEGARDSLAEAALSVGNCLSLPLLLKGSFWSFPLGPETATLQSILSSAPLIHGQNIRGHFENDHRHSFDTYLHNLGLFN